MNRNLFISHSSYDKKIIEILSNLIRRVSLNQIHIWYSNDQRVNGGFLVGDNWFGSILNNLKNSQAVISFITPNSNNNPWILYESGYAEALEKTKLIPLKFLMNISEISIPLQQKQIFSFTTLDEANVFLKKVLDVYNILYDEEIYSSYVLKCLNQMRDCYKSKTELADESPYDALSKKIDSYFELVLNNMKFSREEVQTEYEVLLEYINIEGNKVSEYLKINSSVKVSDILDSVYFILNGKVEPYKYLETWIIKEKGEKRYVVVSDVQNLILARDIFRPNTKWEVVFLKKPYVSDNSYNAEYNEVKMESYTRYQNKCE